MFQILFIIFIIVEKNLKSTTFSFDKIFTENSSQKEIFETTTKNIIDNVIYGYNGTIILYGQTGTGKTYTISNDFDDPDLKGIIPRTFEYLFNKINDIQKEDSNIKIDIKVAFIQIYLETIQDLLCPEKFPKLNEDNEKKICLENCQWTNVKNEEECKEVFEIGSKNRVTESTKMNKYSSRSHSIFMISIENNYPNEKLEENIMTKGILYLVDLAGSEKVAKSYLKGEQLEQAKKNNNTLNVLGNCINCIISNESFIPFRESKLTRILQDTLLGNAYTSLIVTLSPSNLNVVVL